MSERSQGEGPVSVGTEPGGGASEWWNGARGRGQ